MAITLNGTTGISLPNGSASAPAATGTDTDTGIVYGTNTVQVATGGTTAVTVDSSQNVGIGTSSPDSSNKLQVTGDIGLTWATDKFIGMKFGSGGSYKMGLMLKDSSRECKVWSQSVDSDDKITFYTGSTPSERMRIDSSGQLLINTTSQFGGGYGKLQVYGASTVENGMSIKATGTSGTMYMIGFYNSANSNNGTISSNGTNVSYNTSSDYRLKENIAPMTGALAKIAQLKPVTYTWKSTGEDGQGFIAHELAEVVPDCVTGEKDAVDADGNPVYQGIDTSFLVATLTASIQELKAIVDAQAERISVLENNNVGN
jgi:hypothetical protein